MSDQAVSTRRWPLLAASTLAVVVAAVLALDNIRLRSNLQDQTARANLASLPPAVSSAELTPVPPPVTVEPRRRNGADDGALAAQLAALEKELKSRDATIADLRATANARSGEGGPRPERGDRGNFNPQAWMEDLRTSNPQRFEEMQRQFKEMSARTQSYLGKQEEFLKGLKTDNMTPEQRDNHDKLQATLARAKELNDQINADPEGAQVGELRGELFGVMRESRELLEVERQVALQDMATQLGYSKEQAPQFVEYVNHIYEMTSPGSIFRGMIGGGGPGGGGGRGGGGSTGGNR